MNEQQDLLFELGCEELPPKNLLTLSNALLNNMLKGLDDAGLSYQNSISFSPEHPNISFSLFLQSILKPRF